MRSLTNKEIDRLPRLDDTFCTSELSRGEETLKMSHKLDPDSYFGFNGCQICRQTQ